MSATVNWPAYQIGPRDSVFAIGVASSKFAELEQVLGFIFGIVFGVHDFDDELIVASVGSEAAAALITTKLNKLTWPEEIKTEVQHFIAGFHVCAENRNSLIHSVMESRAGETAVLFKTAKQGRAQWLSLTLEELQAVADSMNAFCQFGRSLGNWINTSTSPLPFSSGTPSWPDRPRLPRKLDYKGGSVSM